MARLFGTDGVRGVANRDLTPDLALTLGRAAGAVLAPGGTVVLGRDTRLSGPMLEAALAAGFCSAGTDVLRAGIVPTPAVAFLTTATGAAAGAVVSASHNPVEDNGIKFFSGEGSKITADLEDTIEHHMQNPQEDARPVAGGVGEASDLDGALEAYVDHLLKSLDAPLAGLRVVLDCAFGAAWKAAPEAFAAAGAEPIVMNADPDGARINVDCGSTSLGGLQRRVVSEGAVVGLGFDGDADRVLAVDEAGRPVDGDQILALLALRLHEQGALTNDVVVTTVMANLGFHRALEENGVDVVAAPVGDRFVAEAMSGCGAVLGGEQSGHIIFAKHSTTGDGILTGLQLCTALRSDGLPLSALAHVFEPYAQVLLNVPVAAGVALDEAREVWDEVAAVETTLDGGRVLVRASGTEPVVRVLVEASDEGAARLGAERLAATVERHLGR